MVENELVQVAQTYRLEHVQFQSGTGGMTPSALVRLGTPEGVVEETSLGDGPVDASFKALAKLTPIPFSLESYDLKAIGKGTDALGEVSIRVNSDGQLVTGRAVSTDVVHASVLSLCRCAEQVGGGDWAEQGEGEPDYDDDAVSCERSAVLSTLLILILLFARSAFKISSSRSTALASERSGKPFLADLKSVLLRRVELRAKMSTARLEEATAGAISRYSLFTSP